MFKFKLKHYSVITNCVAGRNKIRTNYLLKSNGFFICSLCKYALPCLEKNHPLNTQNMCLHWPISQHQYLTRILALSLTPKGWREGCRCHIPSAPICYLQGCPWETALLLNCLDGLGDIVINALEAAEFQSATHTSCF